MIQDTNSSIEDFEKPSITSTKISKKLYWYSVIMGFAVLQPGNEIITCIHFFIELYKPIGYKPQFTFPMMIFLPLVGCQIFLIAYGSRLSMKMKLVFSLSLFTTLIYLVLLIGKSIENKVLSFYINCTLLFSAGVFNGIAQSAIGGLTGAMGGKGKYMEGNIIGNGISGMMSNLINLLARMIIINSGQNEFKVTMLFFLIVGIIMLFCVFITYLTLEDPYTASVVEKLPQDKSVKGVFKLAWPIFKKQGKNVFFIYVISFSVFPGVIIAKPLQFIPIHWSIIVMILLFNGFDTVGRFLTNCIHFIGPKAVTWIAFLRVLILVSICSIGYGLFNNLFVIDWWIIVNIILLAVTNGLATNLAMTYQIIDAENDDKEDTGKVMTIFLTGGIFMGTLIGQFVFANLF